TLTHGQNPRADAGLHGAQGQFEAFRELGVSIPFEEGRLDEAPLLLRQADQRIHHLFARFGMYYELLGSVDVRDGTRRVRRGLLERGHGGFVGNPSCRKAIDRAVAADAHEPRCRAAALRVVQLGTRPDTDEDLLKDLLGLGPVTENSQDETEQESVVT